MCKKLKGVHNRIDKCMINLIENIGWLIGKDFGTEERVGRSWKTVACCCGHGKYPMTIVVESPHGNHLEIVSDKYIDRKRNFYKKDKQGYYYIPEVVKKCK